MPTSFRHRLIATCVVGWLAPTPAAAQSRNTPANVEEPSALPKEIPPLYTGKPQQEEEPPIPGALPGPASKRKVYGLLYAGGTYNSFTGDAFGTEGIVSRDGAGRVEAVLLPDLRGGWGFEIGLGFQYFEHPPVALGMSMSFGSTWIHPRHISFDGRNLEPTADLNVVRFESRLSFAAPNLWLLYTALFSDLAYLHLTGTHGLAGMSRLIFDSSTREMQGVSFGVGVGTMFRWTPEFGLDAFVGYRALAFSSIEGVEIDDAVGAGGLVLRIGPALLF